MKMKKVVCSILILSMMFLGTININIFASSKWDGLLYITDKSDVPENINPYFGQDVTTKKDKFEKLYVRTIKPADIESISAQDYENVCIDGSLINSGKANTKITELFQNGSKIIIREDDAKLVNVYKYFDVNYEKAFEFADNIDSQQDEKLRVIGISLSKDENGTVNSTIIRAEKSTNKNAIQGSANEKAIQEAIAYSIKIKQSSNSKLVKKSEAEKPLLSFNNAVYAGAPDWTISASNTWVDRWTSVTVNYGLILQKYPDNPINTREYLYLNYSNVTLTPQYRYAVGDCTFHEEGDGINAIQDYGPKPQSASPTVSVSVGAPANISFSYNPGANNINVACEGMTGMSYTNWKYDGSVLYWPTPSQVCGEFISVYKKYSNTDYKVGFNYSVKMYYGEQVTGLYLYNSTASVSTKCVTAY